MKLYYYHDKTAHKSLNDSKKDYTSAYIPVMLKNMGFTAYELDTDALESGVLEPDDAVIFGADTLSNASSLALSKAVNAGARAIGLGTDAKRVFPIEQGQKPKDEDEKYKTVGYFRLFGSDEPLPIIYYTGKIIAESGEITGYITEKNGKCTPALWNSENKKIYCFSFDLAAVLLYIAEGKPTNEGIPPFPLGRIPDGRIIEKGYNLDIACLDSYMRILGDILSEMGFAHIYALPASEKNASDMVLFFAGDDDAGSRENDLAAAKAMHKRGLPYHLNLMPADDKGSFVIDKKDFDYLHSIGCETALHYNFLSFPYSEEGHRIQSEMYKRAFGEESISPVNHCLIQVGSPNKRYHMQVQNGAKSDNNRFQNELDPSDINAFNLKGFAFGSAFPRFVTDDAEHSNMPLDFCEIPGSYYEPRIYDGTDEEKRKISDYLDDSYYYKRTSQLFTHPHYISGVVTDAAPALKALDFAIEYVKSKSDWRVLYFAPERLACWWHDRAKCIIKSITKGGFTLCNPTEENVTAVLPFGVSDVKVSNGGLTERKDIAGKEHTLVTAGPGETETTYKIIG